MLWQREPKDPAHEIGSPLIQWVGSIIAPSLGEVTSPGVQGPAFSLFPWMWEAWWVMSRWVVTKSSTNHLNEFYVLFVFTNVVPLNYSIIIE